MRACLRSTVALLSVAALACGGIDKDKCEAAKVGAYKAWAAYQADQEASFAKSRDANLRVGGQGQQNALQIDAMLPKFLDPIKRARDSFTGEGYTDVARLALVQAVTDVLTNMSVTAGQPASENAKHIMRAPALAGAVTVSNTAWKTCSDGDPWDTGEAVAKLMATAESMKPKQEALVQLTLKAIQTNDASLLVNELVPPDCDTAQVSRDVLATTFAQYRENEQLSGVAECHKLFGEAPVNIVETEPFLAYAVDDCDRAKLGNLRMRVKVGGAERTLTIRSVFVYGDRLLATRGPHCG